MDFRVMRRALLLSVVGIVAAVPALAQQQKTIIKLGWTSTEGDVVRAPTEPVTDADAVPGVPPRRPVSPPRLSRTPERRSARCRPRRWPEVDRW